MPSNVLLAVTLTALALAACRSTTKGEVATDAFTDAVSGDGPARAEAGDAPRGPLDTGAGPAEVAAGADSSPETGGFACGATVCGANQLCVRECTCGGAFMCVPRPDGGACPGGPCPTAPLDMCAPVCTNPEPACRDLPSECNGTPSDACLAGKVCPGVRTGRRLDCVCPP